MPREEDDSSCDIEAENEEYQTGRWTPEEHERFLQGLKQYNKQWKLIADLIRTRTVVQVRTHAQKHFQKLARLQAQSGRKSTVSRSISSSERRSRLINSQKNTSVADSRRRSKRASAIAAASSLSIMNMSDSESAESPSPRNRKICHHEHQFRSSSHNCCRMSNELHEAKKRYSHQDHFHHDKKRNLTQFDSQSCRCLSSECRSHNRSNFRQSSAHFENSGQHGNVTDFGNISNFELFKNGDLNTSSTESASTVSEVDYWCRDIDFSSPPPQIDAANSFELPFSPAPEWDMPVLNMDMGIMHDGGSSFSLSLNKKDCDMMNVLGNTEYDFLSFDFDPLDPCSLKNTSEEDMDVDSFVESLLQVN